MTFNVCLIWVKHVGIWNNFCYCCTFKTMYYYLYKKSQLQLFQSKWLKYRLDILNLWYLHMRAGRLHIVVFVVPAPFHKKIDFVFLKHNNDYWEIHSQLHIERFNQNINYLANNNPSFIPKSPFLLEPETASDNIAISLLSIIC